MIKRILKDTFICYQRNLQITSITIFYALILIIQHQITMMDKLCRYSVAFDDIEDYLRLKHDDYNKGEDPPAIKIKL